MTDRYQEIRKALAMGPTPGPWFVRYDYVVQAKSFDEGRLVPIAQPYGLRVDGIDLFANARLLAANARLLAACDPDTIRALLAERDALVAENARLRTVPMKYRRMAFNAQLQDENNELRAQLVAAQEEILIERSNGDHWRDAYSKWVNTDKSARRLIELQEQLTKAEQRVAEAIVDMLQQKHRNCFGAHSFYLAASVATANGEWRKFVKEV